MPEYAEVYQVRMLVEAMMFGIFCEMKVFCAILGLPTHGCVSLLIIGIAVYSSSIYL